MRRDEIIHNLQEYFSIQDLVGKRTYEKYKERAWRFLDTDTLHALLIVREGIGEPINVNYGSKWQRGLRTNIQQIVRAKSLKNRLYISAHVQGKAFDFDVKGWSSNSVRQWALQNKDKFPFKIRFEDGVSWVHMDTIDEPQNPHVYLFNP